MECYKKSLGCKEDIINLILEIPKGPCETAGILKINNGINEIKVYIIALQNTHPPPTVQLCHHHFSHLSIKVALIEGPLKYQNHHPLPAH